MRNVRANGSPSGLNQTSATVSPLYFKAAHCFEGGCSEKFTPHLPPLGLHSDPATACQFGLGPHATIATIWVFSYGGSVAPSPQAEPPEEASQAVVLVSVGAPAELAKSDERAVVKSKWRAE